MLVDDLRRERQRFYRGSGILTRNGNVSGTRQMRA